MEIGEDQKELILALFNDLEFIDTIIILLYTGLRIGELLTIKRENLFLCACKGCCLWAFSKSLQGIKWEFFQQMEGSPHKMTH